MRIIKGLVAAGLLVGATGCVETNGYPGTSMGGYGYPSSYGSNAGYYGQPAYNSGGNILSSLFGQQQQPAYYPQAYYPQAYQPAPQYIPVPVASQPQYIPQTRYASPQTSWSSQGRRDRNADGIADWKQRDRNADGVPDYQQRDRNGDGVPDYQQRRGRSG